MAADENLNQHLFGEHRGSYVAWMDINKVWRHREYDRSQPSSALNPEGHGYTSAQWHEQQESVRKEGIKQPLIMQYEPKSHRAIVGEGNHRLIWAREAGHQSVPVTVIRTIPENIEGRTTARHEVQGPRTFQPGEHVPADMNPRQIFPTEYGAESVRKGREVSEDRLKGFFNDRRS